MRRPDLVAKVQLHEGTDTLIVVHTEIQVSPDPKFAERMFTYFYHLREQYELDVVSLAVLADANPRWHPTEYRYERLGTAVHFAYLATKLLSLDEERLRAERNPFALFVLAHLASLKYRGTPALMAEEKKRLFRQLLEGGYNAEQIRYLYQEVDLLMSLPVDLEREVEAVLEEIKRRRRRKWIAPQERLAVERGLLQGLEEGRQQGLQQGLQQGFQQGIFQTVETLLRSRFREVPEEVHTLLLAVSDDALLLQLSVQAVQVSSLSEFTETLRSIVNKPQGQNEETQ